MCSPALALQQRETKRSDWKRLNVISEVMVKESYEK